MNILIFGASGLVGSSIAKVFSKEHNVTGTFFNNDLVPSTCHSKKIDIRNFDDTKSLIYKVKPDLIIDTVSYSNVDKCETDPELTRTINIDGTKNIVNSCTEIKPKLVFISTAFVFGDNKKNYHESDSPFPINNYGMQKLEGEQIIQNSGLPYLILRTDQIYGWTNVGQRQSYVDGIFKKLSENQKIDSISDWYNCPTFSNDIAECILSLVQNNKTGIFHVVGSDYINRYDWALKIGQKFNFNIKLIKTKNSSQLNLPAKRPNTKLDTTKLFNEISFIIH